MGNERLSHSAELADTQIMFIGDHQSAFEEDFGPNPDLYQIPRLPEEQTKGLSPEAVRLNQLLFISQRIKTEPELKSAIEKMHEEGLDMNQFTNRMQAVEAYDQRKYDESVTESHRHEKKVAVARMAAQAAAHAAVETSLMVQIEREKAERQQRASELAMLEEAHRDNAAFRLRKQQEALQSVASAAKKIEAEAVQRKIDFFRQHPELADAVQEGLSHLSDHHVSELYYGEPSTLMNIIQNIFSSVVVESKPAMEASPNTVILVPNAVEADRSVTKASSEKQIVSKSFDPLFMLQHLDKMMAENRTRVKQPESQLVITLQDGRRVVSKISQEYGHEQQRAI